MKTKTPEGSRRVMNASDRKIFDRFPSRPHQYALRGVEFIHPRLGTGARQAGPLAPRPGRSPR